MQVFVPHTNFKKIAKILDSRRLNKQIVECMQIIEIINGKESKWKNHPAILSWRFNVGALINYTSELIEEMKVRGYKWENYQEKLLTLKCSKYPTNFDLPIWWGDEDIHSSHRSRLVQKGVESYFKYDEKLTFIHYQQFGWDEFNDPNLMDRCYIWAIPDKDNKLYSKEIREAKSSTDTRLRIKDKLKYRRNELWE